MPDTGDLSGNLSGALSSISASALFASLIWGALSGGFVIYGWKQKALLPFFVGLALGAVSYFLLSSALYMSLACVGILAVFFWLKKQGY